MTIPIKCIFQGGGAKLVTLLAAAEVLEELEKSGRVVVTEVAGTSAGSIAAYAFAHKKPTELLRARMKSAASSVIEHFSSPPGRVGILYKIYKGRPIFDETKLHEFLRSTFSETEADRPRMKDSRIPVHIRVSDIKNGRIHTYKPEDDVGVENALIDSCAIPLAFRTHVSNSPYADGGITSNLVDNSIFRDPTGNVIAFSFPRGAPYQFSDVPTYLMSLASTAIDASVEEARSRIEAQGGFVCELPNEYRTFDFRDALEKGLGDEHFAATKRVIRAKIEEALAYFERADRKLNLETDLLRVQRFTGEMFERVMKLFPFGVSHCSISCIAQSLETSTGADGLKRDKQIKDLRIEAKGASLIAFRVGIGREELYELGKDIRWEVRDNAGSKLSATHGVIESEQNGSRVWHSCFVLDAPLPAERAPVRVRLMTSHVGIMKELLNGGSEWMRTVCSQDDDVQVQDLVFAYPERSGTFVMTDLLDNYHRTTQKPDNLEGMTKAWCAGEKMNESDLEQYVNDLLSLSDYAYIGWRCRDMQPKSYAGALIERAS